MNQRLPEKHLSEDEFASWALGKRALAQLGHVRGCAACRRQTDELTEVLAHFREAARGWAELQPTHVRLPAPAPWWQSRPRWTLVAAVLFVSALFPVYDGYRRDQAARHLAQGQAEIAADTALLRQVDAGISRAVPEPMEPLVSLVSWNSGSVAGQ